MRAIFKKNKNSDLFLVSTRMGDVPCLWEEKMGPEYLKEYDITFEIEDVEDIRKSDSDIFSLNFENGFYTLNAYLTSILEENLYLFKIDTDEVMVEKAADANALIEGFFYNIFFRKLMVFNNNV